MKVWIYEAIARAGELYEKRQNNSTCPHILHWTAVTQPTDSTLKVQLYSITRFNCSQVASTLQHSQTEKNSSYYKSVMAWVRPVRPVQFVDGFKTLQKEDNHVTITFQLKPHVSPITKSFFSLMSI